MGNLYQRLKGWLANPNMFHIWYAYFLANVYACLFKLDGAVDPLIYIILCPVLSWMTLVFIECFDGYYGTKQLDKTGVQGNIFSTKDLLYDAIGAVLGMVTIGIKIL